jgi:hypothetical protein
MLNTVIAALIRKAMGLLRGWVTVGLVPDPVPILLNPDQGDTP